MAGQCNCQPGPRETQKRARGEFVSKDAAAAGRANIGARFQGSRLYDLHNTTNTDRLVPILMIAINERLVATLIYAGLWDGIRRSARRPTSLINGLRIARFIGMCERGPLAAAKTERKKKDTTY